MNDLDMHCDGWFKVLVVFTVDKETMGIFKECLTGINYNALLFTTKG